MGVCSVPSCPHRTSDKRRAYTKNFAGFSLHAFPSKNPTLLEVWAKFINGASWKPSKYSRICSVHFAEKFIDRTGQKVRLRENAVPTLRPGISKLRSKLIDHETESRQACPTLSGIDMNRYSDPLLIPESSIIPVIASLPADNIQGKENALSASLQDGGILHHGSLSFSQMNNHLAGDKDYSQPGLHASKFGPSERHTCVMPVQDSGDSFSEVIKSEDCPGNKYVLKEKQTTMFSFDEDDLKKLSSTPATLQLAVLDSPMVTSPCPIYCGSSDMDISMPSTPIFPMDTRSPALLQTPEHSCLSTPPQQNRKNLTIAELLLTPTNETPKHSRLRKVLKSQRKLHDKTVKKFRNLKVKHARLQKRFNTLKEALEKLREERKMSDDRLQLLEDLLPEEGKELVECLNMKAEGKKVKVYSEKLRIFALTLHFYSPSAYKFVRSVLSNILPHERTIRKWYSKINGEPGFTEDSFQLLKAHSDALKGQGKSLIVALMEDDVHIKKHVDGGNSTINGYVDCGGQVPRVDFGAGNCDDDSQPMAAKASVFMAVSLADSWKLPLGYFLVSNLSGAERAGLVRTCIEKLYDVGVVVASLTFDGAQENLTMASALGAYVRFTPASQEDIDLPKKWKSKTSNRQFEPSFPHPCNSAKTVHIIQDAAHLIKLIRNALAEVKVLINSKGEAVKWIYFERLHDLQTETEDLHLANKLKKAHVEWTKRKQSVKLAAQLLSSSVADALIFCRNELALEDFTDVSPTVEFCRLFDQLFDVMNSCSSRALGFKAAMKPENIDNARSLFHKVEEYIIGLKHTDGTPVLNGRRKVAFTGILITIKSIDNLYNELVTGGHLPYLRTYQLSQDHLELFFGQIRQRGGWCNNPTVVQFKSAYKRLLTRLELLSVRRGNCISLSNVKILHVSSVLKRDAPLLDFLDTSLPVLQDEEYGILVDCGALSPYVESVVPYIAGFIVKKLESEMKCSECACALVGDDDQRFPFIALKNTSRLQVKLFVPSNDVVKTCKLLECIFRVEMKVRGLQGVGKIQPSIISRVVQEAHESGCFSCLIPHVRDCGPHDNHISTIISTIAKKYLRLRLGHAARLVSEDANQRKRYNLNRSLIFTSQ